MVLAHVFQKARANVPPVLPLRIVQGRGRCKGRALHEHVRRDWYRGRAALRQSPHAAAFIRLQPHTRERTHSLIAIVIDT